MFKITRVNESRLNIEMNGKLNSEEIGIVLDELVSKSDGIENGRMLYDVVDYHLPSLGAIGIEFSRLPSMLGLMKKFDRAAVLTDKGWIKMVSEIEGVLYPGIEIKAFNRDQKVGQKPGCRVNSKVSQNMANNQIHRTAKISASLAFCVL